MQHALVLLILCILCIDVQKPIPIARAHPTLLTAAAFADGYIPGTSLVDQAVGVLEIASNPSSRIAISRILNFWIFPVMVMG